MGESTVATDLRERVRIEFPQSVADGLGGRTISWQLLAECWAQIEPLRSAARAAERSAQRSTMAGYRVRMRLRDDVDATMRIIWRNRVLMIHSLHELSHALELLAYEEQL